ncbi:MAG: hypothetical protein ACK5BJ_14105 [Bacteroidota bacterium]|jgi:hypothetical protein|nr:hypothetical protein [Cytophagales bacterium]
MKNIRKFLAVLSALAVLGSCELYKLPELPKPNAGKNGLDLSKMVSVGNSLTAGFMNGALYSAGQANSYPAIIAAQMAQAGGGTFNQATTTSINGCFNGAGGCTQGRLVLKLTRCNPNDLTTPLTPGPVPTVNNPADPSSFASLSSSAKSSLNNFGVPGVTLGGALSPALAGNPYYNRIASAAGTSTLIQDASTALANGGTFFTFWLGNNDILGYATAGGTGTFTPADNSPTGFGTLFNTAFNAILAANGNTKGVVANIPDVTSIPYFSTLNPLAFSVPVCSRAALGAGIDQINGAITAWNTANAANPSAQRPLLSKNFDRYPLIILDPTLPDAVLPGPFTIPKIRNVRASDGILLCLTAATDPAGFAGGMGLSPLNPINEAAHDRFYLTPAEITEIKGVVTSYNQIISTAVSAPAVSDRVTLVDANSAFVAIAAGTATVNGSGITASITPPFGAFSLDGIHPNARGYAYIANLFIQEINTKWGSTIPLCNPNNYPSNELPSP